MNVDFVAREVVGVSIFLNISVRVDVRLDHPRPTDRSQHGCTVGVHKTHPCAAKFLLADV